ncbi:MAG: hypothetical protein IH588_12565 [Anaerolineales bacterium]|nr:hypothetical protein [Anaerolineales bacterium]
MEVTIRPKGSQTRCHKCGTHEVDSICHHCGRPMCSKHGPIKPTLRWFTENREFKKLTLGTWPLSVADGAHCEYHVHSTLNYRRLMIVPGALIGLAGIVLLILSTIKLGYCVFDRPSDLLVGAQGWADVLRDPQIYAGVEEDLCYMPSVINRTLGLLQALAVLILGIGVMVFGRRFNIENIDSDMKVRGVTLPVGPITNGIRIVENVHAHILVGENGIATSAIVGEIQGGLTPSFYFTQQDLHRVKEYKSKYHINGDDLAFQGGYLVLKGDPHIRIVSENGKSNKQFIDPSMLYRPNATNLFRLDGQVNDHDYLLGRAGKSNSAWQRTWTYKVEDRFLERSGGDTSTLGSPVWILPVLVERGKTKVLALSVQLNTDFFPYLDSVLEKADLQPEKKVWIENAKLYLNHRDFGHPRVTGAIVSESIDEKKNRNYEIEWHGMFFNAENRSGNTLRFDGFNVSFDKEISLEAHLRGTLLLRVPSLISTIENVQYYSALGHRVYSRQNRHNDVPQVQLTYIHVDFDIALAKISFPNLVSVPCAAIEMPGAPTPWRLNHILKTFHSGKYSHKKQIFINSVEESQPQLGDEKSQTGRWHWQIFGKQYHDLTPISFHIVMYGSGDQGQKGQTRIEASINATVDENTVALVEKTKEDIEDILKEAMSTEPMH